jgi:hypothetical protein
VTVQDHTVVAATAQDKVAVEIVQDRVADSTSLAADSEITRLK